MSPTSSRLTPTVGAPRLLPECLPNYDLIVTEDDTPVDNVSKQQATLLSATLYASWSGPDEPTE